VSFEQLKILEYPFLAFDAVQQIINQRSARILNPPKPTCKPFPDKVVHALAPVDKASQVMW
jgi:hypothetical protein